LLRADIQKKLASLRERVGNNAVVQEGEAPHEDPAKLLDEAMGALKELEAIVVRINRANQATRLADGRSLMEEIAHRDTLVGRHSLLKYAIEHTHKEPDRYSMSEIKWVSNLKVSSLQRQCDDLAQNIRELNVVIQETNWKAELEE
jgi:hypothetical protein